MVGPSSVVHNRPFDSATHHITCKHWSTARQRNRVQTRRGQPIDLNDADHDLPDPEPATARIGSSRRNALVALAAAWPAAHLAPPACAAQTPAAATIEPFCGVSPRVPIWAYNTPWQEDLVGVGGYKTWWRLVGKQPGSKGLFGLLPATVDSSAKLPLLCISDGPGMPSQYLESLELLAGSDRRILFYDSIGCGNSWVASGRRGPPPEAYTLDLLIEELAAVKAAAGVTRCHVLGHGFGGMLAVQALAEGRLQGVATLSLLSTAPSWAGLVAERIRQARTLPADQQAALLRPEGASPAARAEARVEFQRRFVCHRSNTGCLKVALDRHSGAACSGLMGGDMFKVDGMLRSWSVEDKLGSITVPTLLMRGMDDVISAATMDRMQKQIFNSQCVSFENSGSMAHIDAWDVFAERLDEFIGALDSVAA